VTSVAMQQLGPPFAELGAEWKAAIAACADRKAVEACLRSIQEGASARVAAIAERTSEFVLVELQRASDKLQVWLLEELHAQYEVARRASVVDGAPPVVSEVAADEMLAFDTELLGKAVTAFESRRVGYGLGGAAAGAVLGTLIAPVIGTAIGAFLGVFAGFLKGTDSLKHDCVVKLESCLLDAEKQLQAQVELREPSFASALHDSMDSALDNAARRFERALGRLIDVEQRALAAEREKLARLEELRAALDAEERMLTELSGRPRRAAS
jgi:hypothetical protein